MPGLIDWPSLVSNWSRNSSYAEVTFSSVLSSKVRESQKFEDDTASSAESAYDKFLDQFETSEGQSIKVGHEAPAEALPDEELEQETIVKQKRG